MKVNVKVITQACIARLRHHVYNSTICKAKSIETWKVVAKSLKLTLKRDYITEKEVLLAAVIDWIIRINECMSSFWRK